MATYIRRPTRVEAEQYNGSLIHHEMCEGVCRWETDICPSEPHVHTAHKGQVVIIEKGDWIVKEPGDQGYYPVKAEIFESTYQPIWAGKSDDWD